MPRRRPGRPEAVSAPIPPDVASQIAARGAALAADAPPLSPTRVARLRRLLHPTPIDHPDATDSRAPHPRGSAAPQPPPRPRAGRSPTPAGQLALGNDPREEEAT